MIRGMGGSKNRRRRGFSLIELLIVISIILIIAAIAVPKMNTQLMNSREMAAIEHIRSLHQAQTQFYSQFGRYAASLAELGPPASGTAGPNAADIIPKNLASGTIAGYVLTMVGSPSGYSINANPVTFGSSGRRTFFSDQTGEIRENWSAQPANANSDPIK